MKYRMCFADCPFPAGVLRVRNFCFVFYLRRLRGVAFLAEIS